MKSHSKGHNMQLIYYYVRMLCGAIYRILIHGLGMEY